MRKIVFSKVVKLIAVILLIASLVAGVLAATNGVYAYFSGDTEEIYSFERDFSESWYVRSLLSRPHNLLITAYHEVFYGYDGYGHQYIKGDMDSEETRLALRASIEELFGDPDNFEEIDYYVQWNDLIFTNCGAKSPEDLTHNGYYSYFIMDDSGSESMFGNTDFLWEYPPVIIQNFDRDSTIAISCSIKEAVVKEYKAIWERQESLVINTFFKLLACAAVALLLFIYLLCVCGKNKDGEYKNMWLDNIWVEVHLAAIVGAVMGAVPLYLYVVEEYVNRNALHHLIYWILGVVAALVGLITVTSSLSIVRNIKTRRLPETSIVFRLLKWGARILIIIAKWLWKNIKVFWGVLIGLLSRKTGVILICMLFVYTGIVGLFGVLLPTGPVWLLLGILLFLAAAFVAAYRGKDLDEIKKGVSQVRNGNVGYKIPELKCDDLKGLAEDINDLARGLDESVAAKVKAERLKTELITNVSHDLKTPITSIISYTELLSKVEGMPEEAKDYVAVIAKKSDRLNKLTQDLFDISKVQSGNEDVVLEKLDVSLLINQALGEHDNEIQNSGLPFCVDTPKELYIFADGRKMSRVVSNLINNILKYTMKNTRVFITASEKDGMIEMEFKNISAYPLDFRVEEITQRFVRGDASRTAEGNGLGLAIAKSYTELCNGSFEIVVDGDMFKAILRFRKYS